MNKFAVVALIVAFMLPLPFADACETTRLVVSGNLDSNAAASVLPTADLSVGEQANAAEGTVTITVYDSLGQPHDLVVAFFRVNLTYPWVARVLSEENIDYPSVAGEKPLEFDNDGERLIPGSPDAVVSFPWDSEARPFSIDTYYSVTQKNAPTSLSVEQNGQSGGCSQHGVIDFDGDGIDDYGIWRPEFGMWAILKSSVQNAQLLWVQWGLPGDYPMPGDYSGDGKADLVVWRPSNGTWYVCKSDANFDCSSQPIVQQFGLPGDRPIKGDFDGDGILDFAVWRPSNGIFYYRSSVNTEVVTRDWGLPGDIPLGNGSNQ